MKRAPTAKQIALKALASVLVYGNRVQKREARQLVRLIEHASARERRRVRTPGKRPSDDRR